MNKAESLLFENYDSNVEYVKYIEIDEQIEALHKTKMALSDAANDSLHRQKQDRLKKLRERLLEAVPELKDADGFQLRARFGELEASASFDDGDGIHDKNKCDV